MAENKFMSDLVVDGALTQKSIFNNVVKVDANGKFVAAIPGTDFLTSNFYNSDGTFTANRIVTGNNKSLLFQGLSSFQADLSSDNYLRVDSNGFFYNKQNAYGTNYMQYNNSGLAIVNATSTGNSSMYFYENQLYVGLDGGSYVHFTPTALSLYSNAGGAGGMLTCTANGFAMSAYNTGIITMTTPNYVILSAGSTGGQVSLKTTGITSGQTRQIQFPNANGTLALSSEVPDSSNILMVKTTIPLGANLNTYLSTGLYSAGTVVAEQSTNFPLAQSGILEVIYDAVTTYVYQKYRSSGNSQYKRLYNGSSWGDWVREPFVSEIFKHGVAPYSNLGFQDNGMYFHSGSEVDNPMPGYPGYSINKWYTGQYSIQLYFAQSYASGSGGYTDGFFWRGNNAGGTGSGWNTPWIQAASRDWVNAQGFLTGGSIISNQYSTAQSSSNAWVSGVLRADGKVISGTGQGFQNAGYTSNAANPIWAFANATSYGMAYYQGTALSIGESIGFHFGNIAAPQAAITTNGDLVNRYTQSFGYVDKTYGYTMQAQSGYTGFFTDAGLSTAGSVKMGSLVISSAYSTTAPTNGLYVHGAVKLNNLSGSGTRMVTVDANGLMSTQAITSGGSATQFFENIYPTPYLQPDLSTVNSAGIHTGGGFASKSITITSDYTVEDDIHTVLRLNAGTGIKLYLPNPDDFPDRELYIRNATNGSQSPVVLQSYPVYYYASSTSSSSTVVTQVNGDTMSGGVDWYSSIHIKSIRCTINNQQHYYWILISKIGL